MKLPNWEPENMLTELYKNQALPLADFFGHPLPRYFIHPAAEYVALTTALGVLDLTHWRTLRLTGKDRLGFLNAMVTNDVSPLAANQGCHALLTTTKGKIISELRIYAREDDVLVFVAQGDADETAEVLKKHIIMDDVEVEDLTGAVGVIGIEGPKAYDVLWRMFPTGPFPKQDQTAVARQFEHTDIYLMKCELAGQDCYPMMIPAPALERLRHYIVQAARGSDGLPIGTIAWNMQRHEQGQPLYGIDYTADNFPQESRLEHTVSYAKGCFRGQETIARLKYRGHVNRLLVGLAPERAPGEAHHWQSIRSEFESAANNYDEVGLRGRAEAAAAALDVNTYLPAAAELFADASADKPVGRITSAAYSPRLGKPLAFGYVRSESADPGATVQLRPDLDLRVVDLPVVPPVNDSPKATT